MDSLPPLKSLKSRPLAVERDSNGNYHVPPAVTWLSQTGSAEPENFYPKSRKRVCFVQVSSPGSVRPPRYQTAWQTPGRTAAEVKRQTGEVSDIQLKSVFLSSGFISYSCGRDTPSPSVTFLKCGLYLCVNAPVFRLFLHWSCVLAIIEKTKLCPRQQKLRSRDNSR